MKRRLIKEIDSLAFVLQKYRGNQSGGLNSSVGLIGDKVHRRGVLQTDGTARRHISRAFRDRPTVSDCPDSFRIKHTCALDLPFITAAVYCGTCLVPKL
jgi:hypothetical protein